MTARIDAKRVQFPLLVPIFKRLKLHGLNISHEGEYTALKFARTLSLDFTNLVYILRVKMCLYLNRFLCQHV